jgi:hypothetical protein
VVGPSGIQWDDRERPGKELGEFVHGENITGC